MSQAPSMPFFVDAYLADTGHLSTDEHGAYLLLLFAMWRRGGPVPDDDRDNARVTRMSVPKWRKIKTRLLPFLSVENGEITQKRLQKEWNYVKEKREQNAQNGLRGGRPRTRENNDIDKANGSVSVSENETQTKANPVPYPIPIPIPIPEERKEEGMSAVADAPSKPGVVEAEFVEEVAAKVSHETAQAEEAMELPLFLDRRGQDPQSTATVHALPADPLERALFAYHRAAEAAGWAQCKNFHESRKTQMRGRIKDAGGFRGWCEALTTAANSRFLRGDNNRNWKPGGIDWFLNRANFTKIMEGAYDNPTGEAIGGRDSVAQGFTRAAAAYSD